MNKLPLLEHLIYRHETILLQDVCIIAVQHVLGTTHDMFRYLYRLGLKAENIFLLGKCYSSNRLVFSQMKKDGIYVSDHSFHYDSHQSFDQQFNTLVRDFYYNVRNKIKNRKNIKKIIILDDGGTLLTTYQKTPIKGYPVVGIEQTSSGYEKIKKHEVKIPIINVARSMAKLEYESPIIADLIVQKIKEKFIFWRNDAKKILIIGNGYIGQAIKKEIQRENNFIKIFDKKKSITELQEEKFVQELSSFDLIIGCTGFTSIPRNLHNKLKNNAILVSASSSDREFDAIALRMKKSVSTNCHQDVKVCGKLLINSGFPINFDGGFHSVIPEYIQFTRSLLASAIIQSVELNENIYHWIIDLDFEDQRNIIKEFLLMYPFFRKKKKEFFQKVLLKHKK